MLPMWKLMGTAHQFNGKSGAMRSCSSSCKRIIPCSGGITPQSNLLVLLSRAAHAGRQSGCCCTHCFGTELIP